MTSAGPTGRGSREGPRSTPNSEISVEVDLPEFERLPNGYAKANNARDIACPVCGVSQGWTCKTRRWTPREKLPVPALVNKHGRKIMHRERWEAWRELQRSS